MHQPVFNLDGKHSSTSVALSSLEKTFKGPKTSLVEFEEGIATNLKERGLSDGDTESTLAKVTGYLTLNLK